jgi:hypothetical protein
MFMDNRISALLDSGKGSVELGAMETGEPYEGMNGVAAFIGLWYVSLPLFPSQFQC